MEKALVMDSKDNVATAISELNKEEMISVQTGSSRLEVEIRSLIPFGHKFAIRHIDEYGDVMKYGEIIGRSTSVIHVGQHVHIHNIESLRGRGDLR
jgi:altronate dehydratase small subunit